MSIRRPVAKHLSEVSTFVYTRFHRGGEDYASEGQCHRCLPDGTVATALSSLVVDCVDAYHHLTPLPVREEEETFDVCGGDRETPEEH